MIERLIPVEIGTLQLTRIMLEAVKRYDKIVVVAVRGLIRPRVDELSKWGGLQAEKDYTIMSPHEALKAKPACDLIVVDDLGVYGGKVSDYFKTCQTPVWRRLVMSDPEKIASAHTWPLSDEQVQEMRAFMKRIQERPPRALS